MFDDFISMLTPEFIRYILLPAVIGGVAVTLSSALLGVSLVLKKYSMIGDGLSHVGYGALAIAAVMNFAPLRFALPVVIVAAVILLRLSDNSKLHGDSGIAVFSTTALAIGILVSSKAGLTNDVSHYMFGSILAMNKGDVILSVVISVIVILTFILLYNRIFSVTFDEEFARATGVRVGFYNSLLACLTAVTVVIGMRMMGTLLISALIIFPVLTAVRLVKNYKSVIIASVMVALAGFFGGLILSVILGTSPGSSVVIVNLLIFLGVRIYCLANKK
jgi:zinc transport system permease protein